MRLSPIKKISEGAYFVVDFKNFTNVLTAYDPIVANQTISFGYEELGASEPYEPVEPEHPEESTES